MRSGCGGDTRHVLLDRESIGISAELTNADVRIHCGEFASQSSQSPRFGANSANSANFRVNNLRKIRGVEVERIPLPPRDIDCLLSIT